MRLTHKEINAIKDVTHAIFGEQRIDLLIEGNGQNNPFFQEIKDHGIAL